MMLPGAVALALNYLGCLRRTRVASLSNLKAAFSERDSTYSPNRNYYITRQEKGGTVANKETQPEHECLPSAISSVLSI
eukprot:4333246-Amphidinium_carterae.1